MNRHRPLPANTLPTRRRPLWLAALDGRQVLPERLRDVGSADGPEVPLAVEFVGLTPDQQRAALAAFPGGKRFQLVSRSN
jgi:hypothetical protein